MGARAIGVVLLLVLGVARADSKADDARNYFDEGTKFYNLGNFTAAAENYKLAYQSKPDPVILYNIAQSYRGANDWRQALFFYKSFLHNLPNTPNRAEVEDRIHKLEQQLELKRTIVTPPPNPKAHAPKAAPVTPPLAPQVVVVDHPRSKKWVWGVVAGVVVVVAVGVGVGVGVGMASNVPSTALGNTHVY